MTNKGIACIFGFYVAGLTGLMIADVRKDTPPPSPTTAEIPVVDVVRPVPVVSTPVVSLEKPLPVVDVSDLRDAAPWWKEMRRKEAEERERLAKERDARIAEAAARSTPVPSTENVLALMERNSPSLEETMRSLDELISKAGQPNPVRDSGFRRFNVTIGGREELVTVYDYGF